MHQATSLIQSHKSGHLSYTIFFVPFFYGPIPSKGIMSNPEHTCTQPLSFEIEPHWEKRVCRGLDFKEISLKQLLFSVFSVVKMREIMISQGFVFLPILNTLLLWRWWWADPIWPRLTWCCWFAASKMIPDISLQTPHTPCQRPSSPPPLLPTL